MIMSRHPIQEKIFNHLSVTAGLGITIMDTTGQILYESDIHAQGSSFLKMLYAKLDCEENCRIALLYGCYQARRFGGRYVFFAPSGLVYIAAPLLDKRGQMVSGILAGPFLLVDYDDYINYELRNRISLTEADIEMLMESVSAIPSISPLKAHSISEHIYYVSTTYNSQADITQAVPVITDMLSSHYPIEKEDDLLAAIRKGDIHSANEILGDIIKQVLFYSGSNIEVLRSRVVELIVLLSRAALKGGADTHVILGQNYDYLREIDSFTSTEDIVLWLNMVTRRFTQQVFEFSSAKHLDIIASAVEYIKRNYASKLTLDEIAKHLFISKQYFCRIFKEGTGQTPGDYIAFVRIEESKKLLRSPGVNIIDIPELVGFAGQSYFTKIFKSITNTTPGQYRRENL